MSGRARFMLISALSLPVGLLWIGCRSAPDSHSRHITKTNFGEAWPLAVDSGTLHCDGTALTFAAEDGFTYYLNGMAKARKLGRADIDTIRLPGKPLWVRDPRPPHKMVNVGIPKDISALIDAARALCRGDR